MALTPRTAFVLAACAIVTACTSLSGPAQVTSAAGPVAFSGLLSVGDEGVNRRFILQVHGIDTPKRDDFRKQLTDQFPWHGYKLVSSTGWQNVPIGDALKVQGPGLKCDQPDCTFPEFGQYERDTFSRGPETVSVYSYYWRKDLHRIIDGYLQPDMDANSSPQYRFPSTKKSLLNALLKFNLMDNGFSDAASYLSPLGRIERAGLESTLCMMFADALNTPEAKAVPLTPNCFDALAPMVTAPVANQVEFDFLSHSLGSRMLFDVLSPYNPATGRDRGPGAIQARQVLLHRTRNFFMAANQLPLLALADLTVTPAVGQVGGEGEPGATGVAGAAPAQMQKNLSGMFALRQAPVAAPNEFGQMTAIKATQSGLTVLAFQDPDDFLGFKASDAFPSKDPNTPPIVDIVHRNTDQWAWLIANPLKAHDRELVEPHSLQMILCGATSDQNGTLNARPCP
jgi:hypothetical protein